MASKHRLAHILFSVAAIFSESLISNPQSAPAPNDQSATSLASRSLAAMGASNFGLNPTAVIVGNIAVNGSSQSSFPIVIKVRGTSQQRCELTTAKGTRVTVTSTGKRSIVQEDGSVRWLTDENMSGQRNEFIPALSLLSEYQLSTTTVEGGGSALLDDGSTADVLTLSVTPVKTDGEAQQPTEIVKTVFYLDHTTGYVTRIQRSHFSENVRDSTQSMELRYSDYRSVGGVMIPFHQQTYADGNLVLDLILASIDFSAPVSDSDFNLGK